MNNSFMADCRLKDFTKECLNNADNEKATQGIISEHWKNCTDIDDFKYRVFSDTRLKTTQAYAELSKESEGHWYRIQEMFEDKMFTIGPGVDALKIGNDSMNFLLPIHKGRGRTGIAVFENDENFNKYIMNYTGIAIAGKANIYDYECGNNILRTLNSRRSGRYHIYTDEGLIAFVKFF